MARKSRKNANLCELTPETEKFTLYNTAAYIRLSVEDNKKRGDSLETQKSIIEKYIAVNPDLKLFDVYIDNGITGTHFERPAFKKMLEDIENNRINCIVVKDLSRFGRNAIDAGYYIEKYLPSKKVRFIAVTDNFDTNNSDSGIILSLKNMVNEVYSLDIGKKIKAQAQQSVKSGEFIGSRPPYGYRKSPDNCHKLIMDPETAPIVKQIFEWAAEKVGKNDIVRCLNESNILSPNVYAQTNGIINYRNLKGNGKWQTFVIDKIIKNDVYVGDMTQGKHKSINHKQYDVKPEEWITVPNTHEAIVSRELFAAAQSGLKQVASKWQNTAKKDYTENIFKSKIFCGCCGKNLHRQRNGSGIYYFHCISNSRIVKGFCTGVMIRESAVISHVLDILRVKSEVITGKWLKFQREYKTLKDRQNSKNSEIRALNQNIDTNRGFMKTLYENLVKKILTGDEYFKLKSGYETKIKADIDKIGRLENDLKSFEREVNKYRNVVETVENIKLNPKLTRDIISNLVDKIDVNSDKEIDVTFSFQDEFAGISGVAAYE